jgi:hypothetical protein
MPPVESATERAGNNETDPELAHRRQDSARDRAPGEYSLCSAEIRWTPARGESVRRGLGEADGAPAFLDELGRRVDGVLDRHLEVDAVLVEVDQSRQTLNDACGPCGYSGLPLIPGIARPGAAHIPTVATTTWSRLSAIAPTAPLCAQPYMSAVSRKGTRGRRAPDRRDRLPSSVAP